MNHITMVKSQQILGGERWLNCFESDGHCRLHSWAYNKRDCSSWQVFWFVIFWCLSRTRRRQVEIMNHGQITCRMLFLVLMCIWQETECAASSFQLQTPLGVFYYHQNCIPFVFVDRWRKGLLVPSDPFPPKGLMPHTHAPTLGLISSWWWWLHSIGCRVVC
jgi:hypothetical protein